MFSNIDSKTDANLNSVLVTKKEKSGEREAVRLMVIGSTSGVDGIVKSLHRLGFANASDWSRSQTYPHNSDRSMRILTKWQA